MNGFKIEMYYYERDIKESKILKNKSTRGDWFC